MASFIKQGVRRQAAAHKELRSTIRAMSPSCCRKSLNAGALDQQVTKEDKEKLVAALREWGVLDG